MKRRALVFVLSLALFGGALVAQNAATQPETIGPVSDSRVSEAIRNTLQPKGYRIATPEGPVDLWLRTELESGKNPDPGALYSSLTESAFVGVISFGKDTRDYKGLRIPAGVYTLRYEIQPNNGDHLGTAPTRDFLLLVPAAADQDPKSVYKYDDLVALSAKVNGTNHPAPLNLISVSSKSFPAIYKDDEGHTVVAVKLKTSSGDLPLALVVHGTAAQ